MRKLLLEADHISKIYDIDTKNPFIAMKDISLKVYEGDFICIMGPSGSGKSTLLNNISTIDIPNKGHVYIDTSEITTMSEKEIGYFRYEKLGFIFQNYSLLQSLTMYENIIAPLSLQKKKVIEMKKKAIELAKLLNIEHTLDKFPNECSGGEKQRAAIARALITNPKLIVADEPTGNLDSKNSHELLEMLKNMNTEESRTFIMVTHDPQIASYSSKLIYITDGKIVKELERKNMSQKDYFYEIMKITSTDAQLFF